MVSPPLCLLRGEGPRTPIFPGAPLSLQIKHCNRVKLCLQWNLIPVRYKLHQLISRLLYSFLEDSAYNYLFAKVNIIIWYSHAINYLILLGRKEKWKTSLSLKLFFIYNVWHAMTTSLSWSLSGESVWRMFMALHCASSWSSMGKLPIYVHRSHWN